MRKIAVLNAKGGVGKTTTAVSLSYALSKKGKKVLLVDTDAQGNVAVSFNVDTQDLPGDCSRTIAELITNECELRDAICFDVRPNLDIIFADGLLNSALIQLNGEKFREKKLRRIFSKIHEIKEYDYIIFDCSPTFTTLTQNVMLYVDELIVPVKMDRYSLTALVDIENNIQDIYENEEHEIKISYIVPVEFDGRTKIAQDILEALKARYPDRVTEPIRKNVAISEAVTNKQVIFEYDPKCYGAEDYLKLTDKILSA